MSTIGIVIICVAIAVGAGVGIFLAFKHISKHPDEYDTTLK